MKWILILLVFSACEAKTQDKIYGDWYHVSTEHLVHMHIDKESISWDEQTFQYALLNGKEDSDAIVKILRRDDLVGIIHKSKDTAEALPFGIIIMRYKQGPGFIDIIMKCSEGSSKDTVGMAEYFLKGGCDASGKIIMRLYDKRTIDHFKTFKPVTKISKSDLQKFRGTLNKLIDQLVEKFGEDKLLWIAPVIFQQLLTDLLVEKGYNPMVTKKQAEELFDFFYF